MLCFGMGSSSRPEKVSKKSPELYPLSEQAIFPSAVKLHFRTEEVRNLKVQDEEICHQVASCASKLLALAEQRMY
jgi:hypothetical protein